MFVRGNQLNIANQNTSGGFYQPEHFFRCSFFVAEKTTGLAGSKYLATIEAGSDCGSVYQDDVHIFNGGIDNFGNIHQPCPDKMTCRPDKQIWKISRYRFGYKILIHLLIANLKNLSEGVPF